MIGSLDDAWEWYDAVRTLALDMRRLAGKWDNPELWDVLSRDNRFRGLSAADLKDRAETILADLDDLAVLVLFSVFEVTVRDRAWADVDRVTAAIQHPAVSDAIKDLKETIENGSFGRVTKSFREMDTDLTTKIDQVRKFRNWVAHGRRGRPENLVDPRAAIDRLRRYLARLEEIERSETMGIPTNAPEPEAPSAPPPGTGSPDQPMTGG